MSKSDPCPKRVAFGHHWRHAGPYRKVCEYCGEKRDSMYRDKEDGEWPGLDGTPGQGYDLDGMARAFNREQSR